MAFYNKGKVKDQTVHFRYILLFYFRKEKNARQACCQRWFKKFRAGDFDLNDTPRSGRPTEVDDDKIKAIIELNQRYTTREIVETLNICYSSVHHHLKKLGYRRKSM
ncbi:histone-lysine N-methyltransferase SETMAR-like [Calliopsis andreniformis]|uniref:histone-lysine N-methyltransferase SETMAR-like n=1 Tax=Calliopsis andreniformis TaxID=337506 RepID=UPI003FCD4B20